MGALLRTLWNEPKPIGVPARQWWDWAIVVGMVVGLVVEAAVTAESGWRLVVAVAAAAAAPALLWRRTHPLAMVILAFGVTTAVSIVAWLAGYVDPGLFSSAFFLMLPYALFRWGTGREAILGSVVMLAAAGLSLVISSSGLGDTIGGLAVLLTALALGDVFRYRTNARHRELEQVKLVEREHLARDLHDTVAHHVSAIVVRAQAGRAVGAKDPAAALDALTVIEDEAARTLAEMRSMVRVLRRDEPAELAPSPQVGDLTGLSSDDGGPAVSIETTGDIDRLPPALSTALYRLAQESITNARRHARNATTIRVLVAVEGSTARLEVRDDGDTSHLRAPHPAGFGLLGMRERANLLGGTLRAGPEAGRGWAVTAELPLEALS